MPVIYFDLGDTHVSAAVASTAKAGFAEAVSVPVSAIKKGVVVDTGTLANAIRTAVSKLGAESADVSAIANLSGAHVEVMPTQGLKLISPKNRAITAHDVMEVINHSRSIVLPSDREQIQVIPRAFRVDGRSGVQSPIGEPAYRLEVESLLISAHRESVRLIERAFDSAGLSLDRLVLGALASGLGSLNEREIQGAAISIDMGGGVTDVSLFRDGALVTAASLPVGSNSITQDVAQLLKTSTEEAERLKVEHGHAFSGDVSDVDKVEVHQLGQPVARPMQRKVLAEIIESRVREIARLSKQAVEIGRPGSVSGVPVILTGNGARLPGVDRVMAVTFGDSVLRTHLPAKGTAVLSGIAAYVLSATDHSEVAEPVGGWKEKFKNLLNR